MQRFVQMDLGLRTWFAFEELITECRNPCVVSGLFGRSQISCQDYLGLQQKASETQQPRCWDFPAKPREGQSGWGKDWAKGVRNCPHRHATLESFSDVNFPDASPANNLRMLPGLVL